jgi:hypothetical protein
MSSVTVGGPGLVAVGAEQTSGHAVVWTSPDGITWSRVPDDEAVFVGTDRSDPNGQWMNGVTAGGPGLVAVGADGTGVAYRPGQWSSGGDDFDAAVWTWGN